MYLSSLILLFKGSLTIKKEVDHFPGFSIHEEKVLMRLFLRILRSCKVLRAFPSYIARKLPYIQKFEAQEKFKPLPMALHWQNDKCALLYPLGHQTNENSVDWIQYNQEFLNTLEKATEQFVSIKMLLGRVRRKTHFKVAQRLRKLIGSYNWESRTLTIHGSGLFFLPFSWLCLSAGVITGEDFAVWRYCRTVSRWRCWALCSILPSKGPLTSSEFDHLGLWTVAGGVEWTI